MNVSSLLTSCRRRPSSNTVQMESMQMHMRMRCDDITCTDENRWKVRSVLSIAKNNVTGPSSDKLFLSLSPNVRSIAFDRDAGEPSPLLSTCRPGSCPARLCGRPRSPCLVLYRPYQSLSVWRYLDDAPRVSVWTTLQEMVDTP